MKLFNKAILIITAVLALSTGVQASKTAQSIATSDRLVCKMDEVLTKDKGFISLSEMDTTWVTLKTYKQGHKLVMNNKSGTQLIYKSSGDKGQMYFVQKKKDSEVLLILSAPVKKITHLFITMQL